MAAHGCARMCDLRVVDSDTLCTVHSTGNNDGGSDTVHI
jgi:hypothetical protein